MTYLTLGILCGRLTIKRSLNWARSNLKWLKRFMKLENGIASEPTISRMLNGIDQELFCYAFIEWIGEIISTKNTHLAIDGKALCGATEKAKDEAVPMILNVVETVRGLILAQKAIDSKTNEITAIPELLELLDITGSTVTIDAIGTQTDIMKQISEQGGHFVLMVKKNQPEAYAEIHEFMGRMETEAAKKRKGEQTDPIYEEYLEKYNDTNQSEKNRERYEYRTVMVCNDPSALTKSQKEWSEVKSIGLVKQVRVPIEKDEQGNDITPGKEEFLRYGSRRCPKPRESEEKGKEIQCTAMISDRLLTAEELMRIKRMHWVVENGLHHTLDDTFREDRSPARRSAAVNLSLIRKIAYNILRISMYETEMTDVISEMMDHFCDHEELREKYVFQGIVSRY